MAIPNPYNPVARSKFFPITRTSKEYTYLCSADAADKERGNAVRIDGSYINYLLAMAVEYGNQPKIFIDLERNSWEGIKNYIINGIAREDWINFANKTLEYFTYKLDVDFWEELKKLRQKAEEDVKYNAWQGVKNLGAAILGGVSAKRGASSEPAKSLLPPLSPNIQKVVDYTKEYGGYAWKVGSAGKSIYDNFSAPNERDIQAWEKMMISNRYVNTIIDNTPGAKSVKKAFKAGAYFAESYIRYQDYKNLDAQIMWHETVHEFGAVAPEEYTKWANKVTKIKIKITEDLHKMENAFLEKIQDLIPKSEYDMELKQQLRKIKMTNYVRSVIYDDYFIYDYLPPSQQ
ncbi:MAG: hypothetical protein FWF70_08230 [Bacteroidetes bacterium]|nr:hypothetical protein [Bacteroidota bacterium]MCL1968239.1 hypothetical protein [Bacteroidota bacterium]